MNDPKILGVFISIFFIAFGFILSVFGRSIVERQKRWFEDMVARSPAFAFNTRAKISRSSTIVIGTIFILLGTYMLLNILGLR